MIESGKSSINKISQQSQTYYQVNMNNNVNWFLSHIGVIALERQF